MAVNNTILANITIITSLFKLILKGNGCITALAPSTQKMLKIFEPTTFPIAMSDCFL